MNNDIQYVVQFTQDIVYNEQKTLRCRDHFVPRHSGTINTPFLHEARFYKRPEMALKMNSNWKNIVIRKVIIEYDAMSSKLTLEDDIL